MNIYRFILYSPNGEGYAPIEGGESSDLGRDVEQPTGGSPWTLGEGMNGGDGYGDGALGRSKQTYQAPVDRSKRITNIVIENRRVFINANGDTRKITIVGTPESMFSLTIKDSAACSILDDIIENIIIPASGRYEWYQEFPSLLTKEGHFKTKETYDLTITPAADVKIGVGGDGVGIGYQIPTIKLYQYADPTVTITNSTTQTGPTLSVSGSDVTVKSLAGRAPNNTDTTSYTLTITGSATETAESLYVKSNANFIDNIESSTLIKKVIDRNGETGPTKTLNLDPLTTRTDTTIEGDDFITGDLEVGMPLYAKAEHSKSVFHSLDEDDNIIDYGKCSTRTDKFELENTHDLTAGMIVIGPGIVDTYIESIDCNKKITLNKKQIIKKDTVLTFKKEWWSAISEIVTNYNSVGQACIKTTGDVDIPHGTEVEFEDNGHILNGNITHSGSGSDSITLTTNLNFTRFGLKNTTYTLNLDGIISQKPNAYDQHVFIKKNSSGDAIKMIKTDHDANKTSKTGAVVSSPRHGTLGTYTASTDTFTYTPNNGFTGEDSFTFTMSDGVNTSEEKTVRITVK
jgi:hypothetical protein